MEGVRVHPGRMYEYVGAWLEQVMGKNTGVCYLARAVLLLLGVCLEPAGRLGILSTDASVYRACHTWDIRVFAWADHWAMPALACPMRCAVAV